jgi:hypothetical protein
LSKAEEDDAWVREEEEVEEEEDEEVRVKEGN